MVKCPHCSESIDYLVLEGKASNEFHTDGSWGTPEMGFDFCDEFTCPECGATVAKGEDKAREFLNPEVEETPEYYRKGGDLWRC